jgi:DNA repair protein RadD
MPTGSGKTKTAMEIICDFIRTKVALGGFNSSAKILWFAHSSELCEQAFESFRLTWALRGDRSVNSIKFFGKYELLKQYDKNDDIIIFAGFAKMVSAIKSKKDNVKQILNLIRENIDLVIVDEAHRTMASEWNKAISYFCENQGTQMIGLTATPGRSSDEDTRLLGYFFDSTKICLVDDKYRVLDKPVKFLQKREFLAEVERKEVLTNYDLKISKSEYQNIKKFGNSNKLKEILIDLSRSPARNKIIIREIQKQYELDRKLLVFACSIEHCIIIQSILAMRDIPSEIVISDTSASQREKSIEAFKNGDLKILINFGVLTTGFDAPNINSLLITRPVFSIVLYSQMIGRALRGPKNNGNKKNTVLTLKDNIQLGEVNDLFESFNELWN